MYEGPVGLLKLDPAAVPPPAGPFPGSPLAPGPQQQLQRRSATLQAGGAAAVVVGAGATAGPVALRSGYRDQAPSSPRRTSDTSMSVFGRRSILAAASSPLPTIAVLVPSVDARCFGEDDGPVGESCDDLLPSMVPGDLPSRLSSAASYGRRLNGELPLPGSPRTQQQRRGSEALEALAPAGGGSPGGMSCTFTVAASPRPRDLSAMPASPTPNAGGRSLRASTGQSAGPGPLVPHPPLPSASSAAAAATAALAGAAPESQPSYKSSVRRYRGASAAAAAAAAADCEDSAGGGVPGHMCGSRSSVALREENSGVLEGPSLRRSGVLAWAPLPDSAPGSFAGVRSSHDRNQGVGVGFSRRPEDLPAAPSPANSRSLAGGSPGSTPGTPNGGGSGLPARPPSILTSQPSVASTGSASSSNGIGFSRRPEDLPAAPSPANSRSLAGGGTGSRSGGSTPGSPAGGTVRFAQQMLGAAKTPAGGGGGGGGSVTTDQPSPAQPAPYRQHPPQQPPQQMALQQRRPEVISCPEAGSRGILASPAGAVGPTQPSPRQSAPFAPAPPSPRATPGAPALLQRQQSIGFSRRPEDLPAAPSPANSRSLAGGSPGSTPATPNGGGPFASRPPSVAASQASCMSVGSSSIGFSRRPEDLPAAPSPTNSRSLAGGPGGCSAGSSLRSAGDAPAAAQSRWLAGLDNPSPRSPPVGPVGLSRRLDDLPPAPSPAASRSLRPESSRTAFRSHAAGGAGGGVGGGGVTGARSAVPLATSPASPLRASGNGSSWGGGSAGGSRGGGGGALWSPHQRERRSQQRDLDAVDFAAVDGCTILEDYSDSD